MTSYIYFKFDDMTQTYISSIISITLVNMFLISSFRSFFDFLAAGGQTSAGRFDVSRKLKPSPSWTWVASDTAAAPCWIWVVSDTAAVAGPVTPW